MGILRPSARAAVTLVLLALIAAPLAGEAAAALDSHGCCPDAAQSEDARTPCQYLAPLDCCDQIGVPGAAREPGAERAPFGWAIAAAAPDAPAPPILSPAHALHAHGPPQAAQLRATVLRL
jgi:hypothetical protein